MFLTIEQHRARTAFHRLWRVSGRTARAMTLALLAACVYHGGALAAGNVSVRGEGDNSQIVNLLERSLNPQADASGDPQSAEFRDRMAIERDRLIAVLHGLGYYGAEVEVRIGDVPLPLDSPAAETAGIDAGAVSFVATPGPVYLVRSFRLVAAEDAADPEAGTMVEDVVGLPAMGETLAIVEADWRSVMQQVGHAFAGGVERHVAADDSARMVDVVLEVDQGPLVRLGNVRFVGLLHTDPEALRALVSFQPGERYQAEKLFALREALETQPLIESVRVNLSSATDDSGLHPVTVTIVERPVEGPGTPLDGLIGIAVLGASAISVAGVQVARARSGDSSPWSAHWYFYGIAALLAASAAMVGLRLFQFLG